MFNMAGYAEVKRLLAELQALEEKLMPHELEMLQRLAAGHDRRIVHRRNTSA